MFIKDVIISGFRSYREQSFPDGFSQKTNAIVGKNGSGKSNFFAALQFVLCDKFSNLRASERKELFHVGSGRPSLSIFVEVVFDNKDGRLVIPGRSEEPEVRIRRTIGLKQDEFRVNDRKFSASEVRQLMESAGFSASNPYYIVEQGRIVAIANMTEEERYQLIKDVAGTNVYEARRSESERILEETAAKQAQVDESIFQLEKRLTDLSSETAELHEFQEAEQEKKSIEYCIFQAEMEFAKGELEGMEKEWNARVAVLNSSEDVESTRQQKMASLSEDIARCVLQTHQLEAEKRTLEREVNAISSRQAITKVEAKDTAGELCRRDQERRALGKEREQLTKVLTESKGKVTEKRALLELRQKEAERLLVERERKQKLLDRMQERRNRAALFKSKVERDKWIYQEIMKNQGVRDRAKEELANLTKDMVALESEMEQKSKEVHSVTLQTDKVEEMLVERKEEIARALGVRDELNQKRRKLWQSIHEEENAVHRLEEMVANARHQVEKSTGQLIRQGLQSLRELLEELNDPTLSAAVHGPLIDLIKVESGFALAAEVTAGNTLLNVVVDSFDVSARLLEQMNRRRKPGRISFFPLDTCRSVPRDIPVTPESSPLFSKISCDARFGAVVAEVFGRTAVATTLEVGARLVKELLCDVVTLDGDQLNRRGAITGGFVDRRFMKMTAYEKERECSTRLREERKRLDEMCAEVGTVEQKITDVLNKIESLRGESVSAERGADAALRETRLREENAARLLAQKDRLIVAKRALVKSIEHTEGLIRDLETDLKEVFTLDWKQSEEEALEKASEEATKSKVASASTEAEVLQLATEVELLEDTVGHVERRLTVVADRIRELGWLTTVSDGFDKEQAVLESDRVSLMNRLKAVGKSLDASSKEKQKLDEQMEALRSENFFGSMSVQERRDAVDQAHAQRNAMAQRRDEALQKMRNLGSTPKGVERFASMTMAKLMHQLKGANERLKKYAHVNRKAVDQHSALLATRNDLATEREAIEKERESIRELMEHLDQKKEEAIERTYKQIQYQFERVFQELVVAEGSAAELQLIKPETREPGEDPYFAAKICVSFGLGASSSELAQLSGGQKSLVALAFIFAIQRCDPAPFYLFDEIDAALDSEYRLSVARMIEMQAERCQFIIATFKTELLSVADRVMGIFFHNKVSRMQSVSMEEGIKLLKQAALEEKKRVREEEEV